MARPFVVYFLEKKPCYLACAGMRKPVAHFRHGDRVIVFSKLPCNSTSQKPKGRAQPGAALLLQIRIF